MALQKFTGSDDTSMTGFVVTDLDNADHADGIVRSARKVLQDGARTMARSRTYSWALLERNVSGASAAVNVEPADKTAGIAEFVEQIRPRVAEGAVSLDPGKGVTAQDLAPLTEVDTRSPLRLESAPVGTLMDELTAIGAARAAAAALGSEDLSGRRVAIEGAGAAGPALVSVLDAQGATVVSVSTTKGTLHTAELSAAELIDRWSTAGDDLGAQDAAPDGEPAGADAVFGAEADVVFCGSKLGVVDHLVADRLRVSVVAPIGVAPVTAKGLAVATRRDVIVLPDFLTLLGPLLTFRPEDALDADGARELSRRIVAERCVEALGHPEGAYLGACALAETHLGTWLEELPFGRPLA